MFFIPNFGFFPPFLSAGSGHDLILLISHLLSLHPSFLVSLCVSVPLGEMACFQDVLHCHAPRTLALAASPLYSSPDPWKSGANSRHGVQCECNLETPSGFRTPGTPGEAAKGPRCHPRLDYASTSWATLVKALPLSEPCCKEELLNFKCPRASGLFSSLVVPSPL